MNQDFLAANSGAYGMEGDPSPSFTRTSPVMDIPLIPFVPIVLPPTQDSFDRKSPPWAKPELSGCPVPISLETTVVPASRSGLTVFQKFSVYCRTSQLYK